MHQPKRMSATAVILADEDLYGNGPPHWVEGRAQRPCQTAREAKRERKRAIKRGRRFGKGNKKAAALATLLDSCVPKRRCGSCACAECGRALQRYLVTEKDSFLAQENGGEARGSTALSLIHCAGAVAPGKLSVETIKALKLYSSTALTAAGIEAAIFGMDISFNRDREGSFQPHWLLHLHGHVPGKLAEQAEAQLRKFFPRCSCNAISRPVVVTEFDGNLAGLAYPHKPGVGGREGYLQTKLTADGGTRTCRNTRSRPVRGEHMVEALLFLHRVGLTGRLLLHGVKLVRRRNGSVVFKRT